MPGVQGMKLIGSKQERQIEARLRASQTWILKHPEAQHFRSILGRTFGSVRSALELVWTPDQGEDLYLVLVNGSSIARFEIPRDVSFDPELIPVELYHPLDYKRHLKGKDSNLTYLIAMKIARETLEAAGNE